MAVPQEVPQGQAVAPDLLVVAQEVPQAKVAQAGAQEESQQRPARTGSASASGHSGASG